jgi:hypothetical protein
MSESAIKRVLDEEIRQITKCDEVDCLCCAPILIRVLDAALEYHLMLKAFEDKQT